MCSCCLIYSCKNKIGELKQTITLALLAILTKEPNYSEGGHATDWNEWCASGYSGYRRLGNAISRQLHTFSCNPRIIVHVTALGFALCNYLTVTGTIILELHSNVYDYLYENYSN